MRWIQENLSSLLVGLGVTLVLGLALGRMHKDRKKGGCASGCSACQGCARMPENQGQPE